MVPTQRPPRLCSTLAALTGPPQPLAGLWLCLLLVCVAGCAPRTIARTLGQGNGEVRFTAGGPWLGQTGAPVLIPSFRLGGRVGATDYLDVDTSLALDPFAFAVLAVDIGVVQQIVRVPAGFALSVSTHAHLLIDLDDDATTRGFPELGLHAAGPLAPWLHVFGGLTGVGSPDPPDGRPPVFIAPYVGLEAVLNPADRTRHALLLQVAWASPWEDFGGFTAWEPDGAGAILVSAGWRVVLEQGEPEGAFP